MPAPGIPWCCHQYQNNAKAGICFPGKPLVLTIAIPKTGLAPMARPNPVTLAAFIDTPIDD
jgi:hypothetical protein